MTGGSSCTGTQLTIGWFRQIRRTCGGEISSSSFNNGAKQVCAGGGRAHTSLLWRSVFYFLSFFWLQGVSLSGHSLQIPWTQLKPRHLCVWIYFTLSSVTCVKHWELVSLADVKGKMAIMFVSLPLKNFQKDEHLHHASNSRSTSQRRPLLKHFIRPQR